MTVTRDRVLPAAEDKRAAVEAMFDRIAPRYDVLNRVLTLGMDLRWRRAAVRSLRLAPEARVLDVACGTGDLCRLLRQADLQPVGIDLSAGMLTAARAVGPPAHDGDDRGVALVRGDALALPFPDGAFDGVTCGFALRNVTALAALLSECARVVRIGGRVALLEVATPTSGPARAVHGFWFGTVVPFVGGLCSDRAAYEYLPASTSYLPGPAALVTLVTRSGFAHVERRPLGFGVAQLVSGTRV